MTVNVDAYFVRGDTHTVCEDYAAAGKYGNRPFAIVSDGCSSAQNTDFGSRFLVQATMWQFRSQADEEEFTLSGKDILDNAIDMVITSHLPAESLFATLLVGWVDQGEFKVVAWGDGIIAARRHDGTWEYHNIEYHHGAPAYLAYKATGNLNVYTEHTNNAQRSIYTYDSEQDTEVLRAEHEGLQPERFAFPTDQYDLVLLMSDGGHTFHCPGQKTPTKDVVERALAIKTVSGEFVTRRVRRFIKNHRKDDGRIDDDFSVAGIHVPEPAGE